MKKYVIVFIAGILLVPAAFYLYVRSGYAPVATSAHPMPFERFFAGLALRSAIGRQLPKTGPGPTTEAGLESGAHIYRQNCAVCHGLPNEQPTAISKGMFPHPPQFFKQGRSITYNPQRPFRPAGPRAYWKVKNGIRLSGMPGFKDVFTEQQMWEVAMFVSNGRDLPPAAVAAVEGKTQEAQKGTSIPKARQPIASNRK